MTTEEDFQRAIDANLEDWQTRLVFADWLQERGDPRAAGYRALGQLRLCPFVDAVSFWWTTLPVDCCAKSGRRGNGCSLPKDWFRLIDIEPGNNSFKPLGSPPTTGTRRYVEDAAAAAFGKLPAQRRAKLLAATQLPARGKRARTKPAAKKPPAKSVAVKRKKPAPKPSVASGKKGAAKPSTRAKKKPSGKGE